MQSGARVSKRIFPEGQPWRERYRCKVAFFKIIKMTTQDRKMVRTGRPEVCGINHSFVPGLKPHLTSQFKVSNDPDFSIDVVGLYPPRKMFW